jgi:hypothetical protein
MTSDALSRLESAIAASAAERDKKEQASRAELAAKARQHERARAIWAMRREQLPSTVSEIDTLLKRYGYTGLTLKKFDLKHSAYSASKILLCATSGGAFTCSIISIEGDVGSTELQLEDLTEDALEEAVAHAVVQCLNGKHIPKPD